MKIKANLILMAFLFFLCCFSFAHCETEQETAIIPSEEWSWARGAYNTFSGTIDLSGCNGELTVCLKTDLPYNTESEQQSLPVFTSVNGKRIVMTKQSDTVHFTPESDKREMTFSASFKLPDKQHVESVQFTFIVKDQKGTVLKTVTGRIESNEKGSGRNNNIFYISADMKLITYIILMISALVWISVLIRQLQDKRKNRTGE